METIRLWWCAVANSLNRCVISGFSEGCVTDTA